MKQNNDICIIGSGIAGVYTALSLAKKNIPCTLIDKEKFPRDKVCGESLTSSVIRYLHQLDPQILASDEFNNAKQTINGVRLFAPNCNEVYLPFISNANDKIGLESSIGIRRLNLDNILINHAKSNPLITVIEEFEATNIQIHENGVSIQNKKNNLILEAKIIVIANGYNSKIVKQLSDWKWENETDACGITAYYKNVTGISNSSTAECYLLEDLKSGGMYVMPVENGIVNVNIAIRNDVRKKHKINLRKVLEENLHNHPVLKTRFKDAIEIRSPIGHGYHLGIKKRRIIGERFILIGDAGGFNDAVSANGIAHAMISGSLAAESLVKSYNSNNYSVTNFETFQKNVYKAFSKIRISGFLTQPFFLHHKLMFGFANLFFGKKGSEKIMYKVMYAKQPIHLLISFSFYKDLIKLFIELLFNNHFKLNKKTNLIET
ncbi:MAG TPA: NAD(P)/FAD-dependent oxidoreductase [Sediminibacterium sp.]|uniref:FAD-dependent monooxygenase n=1 Tax=Sediminibacterium sp. TaxID=1917865 RepID=UPI0008BB9875|nr:NAD(P)/FAD-dependent oxidoreductase [Sediminibacterium sp.]OHC86668.1 MAG: hypothetical protein A2472_03640 [Sphingobacteriia bacterium RIFOXYC2_FULL_35_18]OHC88475.1 MAG: hypothetical protein A2546_13605 [Sphingobacteriia bacterium RIFOXYD2_FULL_35_12]HLD51978.1 NAD(P)/FAD-dependent oxidoreductase [Sediminibacterium sp.]